MRLSEYCGKKINVTLLDGEMLKGKCIEYTKAMYNDPEIDSIDLQIDKKTYEIYENEIKNIEIL